MTKNTALIPSVIELREEIFIKATVTSEPYYLNGEYKISTVILIGKL